MPHPRIAISPHPARVEVSARRRPARTIRRPPRRWACRPAGFGSSLKRWSAEGSDGPIDRRETTRGGREEPSIAQRVHLWDALRHAPSDGGFRTAPRVGER